MNFVSTHPFFCMTKKIRFFSKKSVQNEVPNEPVTIGNDVWIGLNVTILPNVTIGNGAVVGAGSIVNRDVPPYAIVAGVPAKVIRYRFTPEQIEQLEQLKWWDLPDEQIRRNLPHFYNVEDIKKHRLIKKGSYLKSQCKSLFTIYFLNRLIFSSAC
ncbi:CatB-related O-acetyltransferase [Vibrio sinaloensis]|nr:CatB-related O-acetyltransferase [Vibrio sinaloensis]